MPVQTSLSFPLVPLWTRFPMERTLFPGIISRYAMNPQPISAFFPDPLYIYVPILSLRDRERVSTFDFPFIAARVMIRSKFFLSKPSPFLPPWNSAHELLFPASSGEQPPNYSPVKVFL